MNDQRDDPAHQAVLDDLRQRAIQTYGQERASEPTLQTALAAAAAAIWRVTQEPLEPTDPEP